LFVLTACIFLSDPAAAMLDSSRHGGTGMTEVRATQPSPLPCYNRLRGMHFVVTPAQAGVHPQAGFPLEPAPIRRGRLGVWWNLTTE
jgi:hypothetical protein